MKPIILAIMLCESGFNPKAFNPAGPAAGIMQLTPIGVKEASIQCGLPLKPNLYDPKVGIEYGTCLFNFYRSISKSDVEAVIMYHAGYKGRALFRAGKSPGLLTSRYVIKVKHYAERFKNDKINLKFYCNKYPSLANIICGSTQKEVPKAGPK